MIDFHDIRMTHKHFGYLAIQRGEINSLADRPSEFAEAYRGTLKRDFETMQPVLPLMARRVLDVGSGLGGISIFLKRYYSAGRGGSEAHLLDGKDDPPYHTQRGDDRTFSNEEAARDFWQVNDTKLDGYHDASQRGGLEPFECDLVISLFSWCFHYAPAVYLDFVRACCNDKTVLIVDLRRSTSKNKIHWREDLERHFQQTYILWDRPKFIRTAWRLK